MICTNSKCKVKQDCRLYRNKVKVHREAHIVGAPLGVSCPYFEPKVKRKRGGKGDA